jgi:uncharacterized membrane protein
MSKKRTKNQIEKRQTSNSMHVSGQFEERRYITNLPDPEDMAKLEFLFSGATKLVLEELQKQGEHRRKLESMVIKAGVSSQNRGLWWSGILGLAGLSVAGYAIYRGSDLTALGTVFLTLASLVGIYVYGRTRQEAERKEKDKNS